MPPQFEILSDEFQRIVRPSGGIELVADGMIFTEGTTWVPDRDMVIWSDFFNNRIMQWSESGGIDVFRQPSNRVNGNTIDLEGRVVSCETTGRKVVREELDGTITTVADRYEGGRFTSPNDVVVKSDGSIWFTDPSYGILVPGIGDGEMPEQERDRVYRVDPETGQVDSVCEDFDKPNGLAFSPDESLLYIADSGRTHGEFRNHLVMRFDVSDGGASIENPAVLAVVDPGVPDGMRVDTDGNLYVAAGDGVQVLSPSGDLLGKILTPDVVTNCAFGMPDYQTLFIAATECVWKVRLDAAGAVQR
jgi:gluconolactonase